MPDGGLGLIEGEQTQWGVVETRPNAEALADRSLRQIGYEPLVVRYNKLIKGHRYRPNGERVRSRHDEIQSRPFIPGYLFLPLASGDDAAAIDSPIRWGGLSLPGPGGGVVETDSGWVKLAGIKRLIRHPKGPDGRARPKLIRHRIVEQIKAAALERDETPKPIRDDLKPGDKVRLPSGMIGYLVSLDDKGRAKYVADLLGGQVSGSISDTRRLELVEA